MGLPSILLAVAVLGAYALYRYWDSSRRHRIPTGLKPLPGPKGMDLISPSHRIGEGLLLDLDDHRSNLTNQHIIGYPILGSVPEVPEKNGFIKFADWGKQYGPIYQCDLAGHNHVWISSDQIAKDLLSKKAAIYSDRPHIPSLIDDNRSSAQYLPLLSRNGKSRS